MSIEPELKERLARLIRLETIHVLQFAFQCPVPSLDAVGIRWQIRAVFVGEEKIEIPFERPKKSLMV